MFVVFGFSAYDFSTFIFGSKENEFNKQKKLVQKLKFYVNHHRNGTVDIIRKIEENDKNVGARTTNDFLHRRFRVLNSSNS